MRSLKSPLRNSDSTGNSNPSRPSTPPPPFSHSSTSESDESHTYNIQETDQSDLRTNNDTLVNKSDSTKENELGNVEQNQSLSTTNNDSENESESVEQNQSLPTTNIESEVKENESVEQNQTLSSESKTKENESESEVKDGNESFEVKNLSKSSSNESEMDAVKEESDSSSARTGTRTRTDTLNSESLYPESEKETQASSKSSFEEIKSSELNLTAEEIFWYFLYIRVSQSSQQSTTAPVVGIEIPLKMMNSKIHSPGIQTVRTWFIFAIPNKR